MVANDLIELLRGGVGAVFPSAVAVVRQDGDVVFAEAVGSVGADIPATIDTVYDLASLTKPMATCSIAWKAISDGVISLDEQVGATLYPQSPIWRAITVRQLMGHASGLPAWRDVQGDWSSPAFFEFEHSPGARAVYSDLGFLALGRYLERKLGAPLDRLLQLIADEFRLGSATYRPHTAAPAGQCTKRGVIQGVVHDPNAYALGGICGHAGLFATALEVANWAQHIVDSRAVAQSALGAVIRTCWEETAAKAPSSWRLGLDSVTPGKSSAGRFFGPMARGHLGYTGTSVWMEPERNVIAVLLTNRVHPVDYANPEIKRFRPMFHDSVAELFFS